MGFLTQVSTIISSHPYEFSLIKMRNKGYIRQLLSCYAITFFLVTLSLPIYADVEDVEIACSSEVVIRGLQVVGSQDGHIRWGISQPISSDEERVLWESATYLNNNERVSLKVSESHINLSNHISNVLVGVTLYDEKGYLLKRPVRFILRTSSGVLEAEKDDVSSQVIEVLAKNGRACVRLKSDDTPGKTYIQFISGKRSRLTSVIFDRVAEFFMVGLLDSAVGFSKLCTVQASDSIFYQLHSDVHSWGNSFFDDKKNNISFVQGRAAFFAKADVGPYKIISAFDSDKLGRSPYSYQIQDSSFYPLYGDSSVEVSKPYDRVPFYFHAQSDNSEVLIGTVSINNHKNQLTRYQRAIYGAQYLADYPDWSASLWLSYQPARFMIDEQPARGVSGPYGVSSSHAILNSERVELVTRDRDHPNLILNVEPLYRFVDYDFEPFTGRLLFRAPLPISDDLFNPNFLRIYYEVDDVVSRHVAYGLTGTYSYLKDTVNFTVDYLQDKDQVFPYQLYGVHASFIPLQGLKIEGGLGFTTGYMNSSVASLSSIQPLFGPVSMTAVNQLSGHASHMHVHYHFWAFETDLDVRRASKDFYNLSSGVNPDRTEVDFHSSMQTSSSARVDFSLNSSHNNSTKGHYDRMRLTGSMQPIPDVNTSVFFSGVKEKGLETRPFYPMRPTVLDVNSTQAGFGFFNYELLSDQYLVTSSTSQMVVDQYYTVGFHADTNIYANFLLDADLEQSISDWTRRRITMGANYQLANNKRLYVRQELENTLLQRNSGKRMGTNTVFGIDANYSKRGHFFSELRLTNKDNAPSLSSSTGVRNSWDLTEDFMLISRLERQFIQVSDNDSFSSLSASIGYDYHPVYHWRSLGRLEYAHSDIYESLLSTASLDHFVSTNVSMISREVLFADSRSTSAGDSIESLQNQLQVGLAFYDENHQNFTSLLRYEWKVDALGRLLIAQKAWRDVQRVKRVFSSTSDPVFITTLLKDSDFIEQVEKSNVSLSAVSSQELSTAARDYSGMLAFLSGDSSRYTQSHILSTHMNWHAYDNFSISTQLGYKRTYDLISSSLTNWSATLINSAVTWQINPRFDAKTYASSSFGGREKLVGIGWETGMRMVEDLWLSIGYTWGNYQDTTLFTNSCQWSGVHVRFRMKFDEDSFSFLGHLKPRI